MTTTETFREMLRRQPVLAAPMCGISDYAYRAICRRMGAELTYTQMVSAVGLSRNDAKTVKILDLEPGEPMVAMQVFGGEPEGMAEAGRMLQDLGAVVVDINMGCPARKITTGLAGSALLRDLARVGRIFRAMRAAVSVPLTVKMRWDWDEDRGAALEAARMAEAEGLDGICLHARTREQGYSGQADWDLIGRVREAAGSLPVIGNGDIRQPSDALAMMRASGCDAVMIGRGVIGDPWLLAECLDAVRRGGGLRSALGTVLGRPKGLDVAPRRHDGRAARVPRHDPLPQARGGLLARRARGQGDARAAGAGGDNGGIGGSPAAGDPRGVRGLRS